MYWQKRIPVYREQSRAIKGSTRHRCYEWMFCRPRLYYRQTQVQFLWNRVRSGQTLDLSTTVSQIGKKYVGWLFHLSEMIADIIVGWIRSHGVGGYIIPTQIRSRVLFSKRKNSSSTLTFVSTCVGAYPRPPDNVIRERARMQICMASWIDFFSLLAQHTDLCTCFQSHFWHTLSQ